MSQNKETIRLLRAFKTLLIEEKQTIIDQNIERTQIILKLKEDVINALKIQSLSKELIFQMQEIVLMCEENNETMKDLIEKTKSSKTSLRKNRKNARQCMNSYGNF